MERGMAAEDVTLTRPESRPAPEPRTQNRPRAQRHRFGRVEFNRPPRLRAVPRVRRVDLPVPPSPPTGSGSSAVGMLVIPLVATAATSMVFVLFALTATGAQRTLMVIASVALVIGTALPVAWMYFEERGRTGRERRRQTEEYRRRLRNREADLLQLRDEEQGIRREHDPDAAALLARARARHRQLWERRPADDDFLALRLGLGLARSDVAVGFLGEAQAAPGEAPEGQQGAPPGGSLPPGTMAGTGDADLVQEALQLAGAY